MLSKSKILIIGLIFALLPLGVRASTIKPFPVAPHNDTQIEWWYLFTHLTTKSNHHDAVVISFFRFLDPTSQSSTDRKTAASQIQDHYMLCGITDEGTGEHTNYGDACSALWQNDARHAEND
jgi:predicted secreted hydrolase